MKEQAYTQIETEQAGMKVVLRFPEDAGDQACVAEEVRQLLFGILLEYFDGEQAEDSGWV